MKKILNWTFGSVFRTFGRILAYISVGVLIALIVSKFDIKISDVLSLPIVHAAATQNWASSQSRYRYDDHGTNTYSSWETTPHTWQPDLPVNKMQWRVKASNGLSYENTYLIKFAYKPVPQAISPTRIQIYADTGTVEYEEINCGQWKYNDDDFNVVQCSFTPRNNISSSTWLVIEVNFTEAYLTSIRSYMNKYEERTGTNAIITQTGDQITNEINNLGDTITNVINESNQNLINSITEQNQVCEIINKYNGKENGYLNGAGVVINNETNTTTDFYRIDQKTKIKIVDKLNGTYYCIYNINKEKIICSDLNNMNINDYLTIPQFGEYIRFTINKNSNKPVYELCKNGNQAMNDNVLDLIHDINDSDSNNALNEFKAFFNLFNNQGHGLTQIVSAPLNAINSLTSSTCSPIVLPLPYMTNKNITLPCMRPIYEEHFGNFIILYDTITFGIISYWVILKLFKLIKNFKNPDDESIEVVDL